MKYKQSAPVAFVLLDGEYPFIVTAAEERVANSGNNMIQLTLKIKGGPTIYDYLVDTETSWDKWNQFRAAIGEKIEPGVEIDINPESWIGRTGRVILHSEEWEGKKRNKVSEYVWLRSTANSTQPPTKTPAPQQQPAPVKKGVLPDDWS